MSVGSSAHEKGVGDWVAGPGGWALAHSPESRARQALGERASERRVDRPEVWGSCGLSGSSTS